jgi:hypothetical protein
LQVAVQKTFNWPALLLLNPVLIQLLLELEEYFRIDRHSQAYKSSKKTGWCITASFCWSRSRQVVDEHIWGRLKEQDPEPAQTNRIHYWLASVARRARGVALLALIERQPDPLAKRVLGRNNAEWRLLSRKPPSGGHFRH